MKLPTFAPVFLITVGIALHAPLRAQEPIDSTSPLHTFVSVQPGTVALTHARLVDGTGAPVLDDHTVLIHDDRIVTVGPSDEVDVPTDALVLDLSGQTVIPGLVDLHEHLYFGGVQQMTPMLVTGPMLYLALGVTSAMPAGRRVPASTPQVRT